ncbi:MAG: N-6 DNA methylase, partial [Cenarchaeum sp. SB0669_bin_11]|nr:N-6 DNA methylase [Cenarchaeum sp. SB0669_bin_11]
LNPTLEGLLADGLSVADFLPSALLVSLIENFEASTDEATPRISLFNTVISRARKLDHFRGEHSTPPDIAELMIQLASQNGESVCDLACGEGGLLSSASLSLQSRGSKSIQLVGYDIDEGALRIARSRFFLQNVAADIRLSASLRVPHQELPQADIVLLDPPLGLKSWGDADIYLDERWRFGAPPRTNADLAWMQLAIQCLAKNGVAVVGASPRTASNQNGREAEIRRAMLEEGVIKAVIQLPSRMRAETSIPVYLWVLQPPRLGADRVMLIDASTLGTASRSQHTFDSADISRIAQALQGFEAGKVEDEEIVQIVGIREIIENDAVLEPKRYRPISEVDIEDVHRRTEELRAKLSDAAGDTVGVVEQVLVSRKGKGDATSTSTCSLEEVAEIHLGTRGAELDADEGTPMIGDRGVSADGVSQPRNTKRGAASRQVVHIQEKDVVVALRGYAGKSPFGTRQEGEQLLKVFQSSDDAGISILATGDHEGAVLHRGYALIRPIGDEVTGTWIYLWTQSSQFSDQVSRTTTGVTMPILKSRALRELAIPIPTAEQLAEAEQLLGRFDDALERVAELQSDLTNLRALDVELLIAHDAGTE